MSACVVPDCPALAVAGEKCALHQLAMTAERIGMVDSTCATCGRKFAKTDFVTRAPDGQVGKKKTLVLSRWRHVACSKKEKRPTKREIAEAPKLLWDDRA
jgi:hypothetical protein